MVKPGKKMGGSGSPFSDKANIMVAASRVGHPAEASVECERPEEDSSSSASRYCTLDLLPLQNLTLEEVEVRIRVPDDEDRNANIWQLHLSPLDDSERVEATFTEDGRQLMRKAQAQEETNTWLTMVSIVGNTGVGKSTVASLLSGNDTMFKAAASSTGTTTIGADISPIISTDDYSLRLEEVLGIGPLHNPNQSRPLFLIDSEGMSFRGDEVDFVNTGPVTIVANIIVWITTGRMRPPEIRGKIADYMDGLDRITMGDANGDQQSYGEFIIVLNMMQDSDQGYSDEDLYESLFAWGSSDEEDAIRKRMTTKFKEIACIGLPSVDNPPVTYPSLENYPRFKEGLHKLGNRILKESETPLNVTVGDQMLEMNAKNAETIIGILIDGANQGNIDLSDICNVLFSMRKESVIQQLAKVTEELQLGTKGLCDNSTQTCTTCACEYRNSAVDFTLSKLKDEINHAVEEANALCQDPNLQEEISGLVEDMVIPWTEENICTAAADHQLSHSRVCDISEMRTLFEESAGADIQIDCDILHVCGNTVVHNSG